MNPSSLLVKYASAILIKSLMCHHYESTIKIRFSTLAQALSTVTGSNHVTINK